MKVDRLLPNIISYDLVGILPASLQNELRNGETAQPKLRRFPKTILYCFMSAAEKERPFYYASTAGQLFASAEKQQ